MLTIQATIYLKTQEEGGLTRPGFSDMQPSFNAGDELIMSRVIEARGRDQMPLGAEHEVWIEVPYGEEVYPTLRRGQSFRLQIGGRVIGEGVVQQVLSDGSQPSQQ